MVVDGGGTYINSQGRRGTAQRGGVAGGTGLDATAVTGTGCSSALDSVDPSDAAGLIPRVVEAGMVVCNVVVVVGVLPGMKEATHVVVVIVVYDKVA